MFNRKPDQKTANDEFAPGHPPPMDRGPHTAPPPIQPATAHATPGGTSAAHAPDGVVESVIGNDLSIEGQSIKIRCDGRLRINGSIQAEVHGKHVVVGDVGEVQGAIAAEQVNVYGRVAGAITGSRVVLHASAEVEGDVHSRSLAIEDGASFDGRSRRIQDDGVPAPKSAEPATAPVVPPPHLHS